MAVSEITNDEPLELGAQDAGDRRYPRLRFEWVGPTSFVVELVGIVATSILSGMAYSEVALGQADDIESFVAVGAAAFLYYGIVSLYRGNYSIRKLASRWQQARE